MKVRDWLTALLPSAVKYVSANSLEPKDVAQSRQVSSPADPLAKEWFRKVWLGTDRIES